MSNEPEAQSSQLKAHSSQQLSDEQWVELHVPRFVEVRPRYQALADFLKAVLIQASGKLAPLAIIETRAKSISSFAEKILRKRTSYLQPASAASFDPLLRMTDLCGGRVIAQTSDQVRAMCRFVEQAFDIDQSNSEDTSHRLRATEFGYRSVHYIVSVNPQKLSDQMQKCRMSNVEGPLFSSFDIRHSSFVPAEVSGLKAEIQVRTLLEHAWADIGHELTYKTELKVPDRIRRQFAALAAVLENADGHFAALVQGLEEFRSNFGAYHERAEVEAEIARLRIVLAYDAANTDLAVKIARLAVSIGRHDLAVEVLQPYAALSHQGTDRARGIALTEMYWDHPDSDEFVAGRNALAKSCEDGPPDAETLCAQAESWVRDDELKARELFQQAVAVDGTEPVTLSRYLEFEIAHSGNDTIARLATPMIRSAIERCRKQIEARVNLPWAWASLALLYLLVEKPFDALAAIAQLIRICEPGSYEPGAMSDELGAADGSLLKAHSSLLGAASRALLRTADALKRIRGIRERIAGFDWCQRAVLLGLAVRVKKDAKAAILLREQASCKPHESLLSSNESIVILSGGCVPELQSAMDRFRPLLLRACEGLSFTLFCGGTTTRISGLAGDVAEQSGGRVRAVGYLPKFLPRDVHEDSNPARFARRFYSPSSVFTPLDPLQGWTDAVVAGVDPRRMKLLSYGGGEISNAQCMLALALGARVGVVEDAALPQDRQFSRPEWQDCPGLVRLPLDAMTLRAFLLVDELPCRRDEFAAAAQMAHEEYLKTAIPNEMSLLPWSQLPDALKVSNFHQVAYAENILKTAGLGIRPLADPNKRLLDIEEALGPDRLRRLAEMEHGRWNAERLLLGWHWAEAKDVANKLSPYLVPWELLSPEIQELDTAALRGLPAKFRQAGLEVYRLDAGE